MAIGNNNFQLGGQGYAQQSAFRPRSPGMGGLSSYISTPAIGQPSPLQGPMRPPMRSPDEVMSDWHAYADANRGRVGAEIQARNAGLPSNQYRSALTTAPGGLMTNEVAQAFQRKTGYMPNMTAGANYGRVVGTDTPEAMQLRKDQALTAAMLAREARDGIHFRTNDPKPEDDPRHWTNQPRQYPDPEQTARNIYDRTQLRPLEQGGPVVNMPGGGLRGQPLPVVNAARASAGLPQLNQTAQVSDKRQALLDSRDALVRARGVANGNDRRMRMGKSPIGIMGDPVTQQNVMQQQMDQPMAMQNDIQAHEMDMARLNHANNLAVANVNASAAQRAAQSDMMQGFVNSLIEKGLPATQAWAIIQGMNGGQGQMGPLAQATAPQQPMPNVSPITAAALTHPASRPLQGTGPLAAIGAQAAQNTFSIGSPTAGPLAAATAPMQTQGAPQAPSPLDAALQGIDARNNMYLGGKLNAEQKAQLDAFYEAGDYQAMRDFERAYGIDPKEMNKYTNEKGNGLLGYLGRDVNIHAPGNVGRIDGMTGENSRTFGQWMWDVIQGNASAVVDPRYNQNRGHYYGGY